MKKNYITILMSTALVMGITALSYGQSQKVKTVTIVNGDTTISETNLNEKDLAKMEKEISISTSGDEKGTKKTVKKIIINEGKEGEGMAYAYATGADAEDVEITTDENGTETRIVIKKSGGKNEMEQKGEKGEKKIVKKEVRSEAPRRSTMNVSITVDKTTAKLEVVTGSKEPLNISILDENGKQVFYDSQKTGGDYSKDIPLEKKGTYFLNLIQNKTSTMEKIIVE